MGAFKDTQDFVQFSPSVFIIVTIWAVNCCWRSVRLDIGNAFLGHAASCHKEGKDKASHCGNDCALKGAREEHHQSSSDDDIYHPVCAHQHVEAEDAESKDKTRKSGHERDKADHNEVHVD